MTDDITDATEADPAIDPYAPTPPFTPLAPDDIELSPTDTWQEHRGIGYENPVTSVRLYGWETFEEGQSPIRALLFGTLANLAWPLVEHYRSDLYHDASWIKQHVKGPTTFYFACDAWGTAIGEDERLVVTYRKNGWRVTLRCEYPEGGGPDAKEMWMRRGEWFADIQQVKKES